MRMTNDALERFRGWPTFTMNDAYVYLSQRNKNATRKSVQVTLSRLVRGGRLHHVTKGVFSVGDRAEYSGFAFSPFYYGGLSALMIRDLIDDQVKLEIMTTKAVRKSSASLFGGKVEVILHHVSNIHYLGFGMLQYGGVNVPVSDPEKTFIDMVYFGIRLSIPDYSSLLRAMDRKRLNAYLKSYGSGFASRTAEFLKKLDGIAANGGMENEH
jgi:predicted transcriptional regulator of viral defense system